MKLGLSPVLFYYLNLAGMVNVADPDSGNTVDTGRIFI